MLWTEIATNSNSCYCKKYKVINEHISQLGIMFVTITIIYVIQVYAIDCDL